MSRVLSAILLMFALLLSACGTGSQIRGTNGSGGDGGGKGSGGNGGGGGGGNVGSPTPVTVAGGQITTGANISVVAPASATPPNAEVLGVTTSLLGALASTTGGKLQRGTSQTVFLFGQGLSTSMQVSITGPSDITISNLQGITATDGTPGIAFSAAASTTAALGARTVVMQSANHDITTFTGGLEIVP